MACLGKVFNDSTGLCHLVFLTVPVVLLCLFGVLFFHSRLLNFFSSVSTATSPAPLSATLSLASPKAEAVSSSRSTRTHSDAPPLSSSSEEELSFRFKTAKKLLCHRFRGRLGNELFQYSATLGLALTMNRMPVFLGAVYLPKVLKTFFVPFKNISQLEARCARAKCAKETSFHKYAEKLTRLDPRFDFSVGQYFATYKYFEKHQTLIRKALTFSDAVRSESERFVQQLRRKYSSSTTLVGVHLRQGDLTLDSKQKLGYPMATPEFVKRSVTNFEKLYPDCVFVVASDSLQWWREHFPKGHRVVFSENHAPEVDMMILASMDHTVIIYGSYFWWVGYFNNGTTVYLKDFIIPNTTVGDSFYPLGEQYFYPGWIPL